MTADTSNSNDRSRQIDAAIAEYLEAMEHGTPLDREEFLWRYPQFTAELQEFLADHSALKQRAQQHGPGNQATADFSNIRECPGAVIGPYKLLEQIGEGGMGVVYMADQQKPVRRRVALKIIKPGMDSRQVIARFEAERQALALMDHVNIARVLDAGTTDSGRPYFVMELVRGISITQYCDQQKLSVRERLELFVQVCQAVQHAHQKGIIHRDLKPSNVLVTVNDGRPVPKVIDFGVAKATNQQLTDKTLFTAFAQMVGTPLYMSPEQAEMTSLDIDTRSDIYSLGVLLYELLTGTTPFDRQRLSAAAYNEMVRIIRDEEPPKPSTRLSSSDVLPSIAANRGSEPLKLNRLVRGELDWIVMKALDKDRNRRYATAIGFAADIQHYLRDEAVQACPPSAAYRFRKLTRRHKAAFFTSGIVAASLVLATAISIWEATLARRAEGLAQNRLVAETEARQQATAISGLLQKALRSANPDEAKGADYMVRELLDDFSAGLGDRLKDQPETAATIHAIIGNAYRGLGLLSKAEPQLKLALDLRERILGPDHLEVAQSKYDYAWCCFERGDAANLVEAEKSTREALAIHHNLGLKNSATIEILGLLQNISNFQNRFDEAKDLGHQALEIAHQQPEELPQTASVLQRLAESISRQGDFAQAEPLARESVELHRRLQGDNHPKTASGLCTLAWVLNEQGKRNEAELCCRKALDIFLKQYDVAHPNVQLAFGRLATILEAKHDEAGLATLHAEMSAREEQKSQRHLVDLDFQLAGAESIYKSGDYYAALAVLDDIIRKHPDMAKAWELRGRCCRSNSAYVDAVENFSQATKLNPNESLYWSELAAAIMTTGDTNRAIADCSKAIELSNRDAKSWSLRGTCYADLEQWEKAEADFTKAIELGGNDEDGVAYVRLRLRNLAGYGQMCAVLLDKATPAAPENWAADALETSILAPAPGIDLEKVVSLARSLVQNKPHATLLLGAALYRAGQFGEAKRQLADASKTITSLGSNSAAAIADHLFLAMACHGLRQPQEAKKWLDTARKEIAERPSTISQSHDYDEWTRRVSLQVLQNEAEQLLADSGTDPTNKNSSRSKK